MNNLEGYAFPMKGLPIQLNCYQDGTIAFEKMVFFQTIVDQPELGVQAIFDADGIFVGANTQLEYNERYEYKQMPELFAWLVAQQMEMPSLI